VATRRAVLATPVQPKVVVVRSVAWAAALASAEAGAVVDEYGSPVQPSAPHLVLPRSNTMSAPGRNSCQSSSLRLTSQINQTHHSRGRCCMGQKRVEIVVNPKGAVSINTEGFSDRGVFW
jgi:hypothetical protein